jgi:hypothetical protein
MIAKIIQTIGDNALLLSSMVPPKQDNNAPRTFRGKNVVFWRQVRGRFAYTG